MHSRHLDYFTIKPKKEQINFILTCRILPNHIQNTKNILKWIKEEVDDKVYISIMAQYFPTYKAKEYDSINRKLTRKELREIKKFITTLDIKNGYIILSPVNFH